MEFGIGIIVGIAIACAMRIVVDRRLRARKKAKLEEGRALLHQEGYEVMSYHPQGRSSSGNEKTLSQAMREFVGSGYIIIEAESGNPVGMYAKAQAEELPPA